MKKSEAFELSKVFRRVIENETKLKIKCLRSNNGGEFTSNEFEDFCEIEGIKRKYSTTRTAQQNGIVERRNQTVLEMARNAK